MCKAPIRIPHPVTGSVMVACHKCWQCRREKIRDWTGRCIAESKTAAAANVVSLTYGKDDGGHSDHPAARWLTYSDIQKFLKRVRVAGYPVRYFVAGEYGSAKGRAHWHLALFWQAAVPEHKLQTEYYTHPFWTLGFSYWDRPNVAAFKYAMKYVLKDESGETEPPRMSKQPPLGAQYFADMAQVYVDQELAPQSLVYTFDEVTRKKDGIEQKLQFRLSGATRDIFLSEFVRRWRERHGKRHLPWSDLVEDYLDRQVRAIDYDYQMAKERKAGPSPWSVVAQHGQGFLPWMVSTNCVFDLETRHYKYVDPSGRLRPLYYVYREHRPEWHETIETSATVTEMNPPAIVDGLTRLQRDRLRRQRATIRRGPQTRSA